MIRKIGLFGSCQLHMTSSYFFSEEVLTKESYKIIFSLPFYYYDPKSPEFKNNYLNYQIFNDLDILIIENNNLDNEASSEKIIDYCRNKNIQIIKTFLIKFPIYPINWSGYGEKISDYTNWVDLDKIDYKKKFQENIISLRIENEKSDLSLEISDFIENNFNKQLLFTHSLHPTNVLLYELYRNIFFKLSINIDDYKFDLQNEIITCWYNPFTTKMLSDLDIQFNTYLDDNFYIERYNKNIHLINKSI
jgi:hypothetical protein